ncbi:hypothetical protein LSM04_009505 [Trypanosoma melophagium]|uniref:uncharacterized protein n=1 Tax=Trypanosoma melophagium TaxID=715481 RepID=UPI00351A6B74|nr:hypothetical protein LSM04_009505 [Trypanosoma melophagium]
MDSVYKLKPWRQQADEKTQRFDELYIRAAKPGSPADLRRNFEERIKSNMPLSQDVAFILMTLLYSGSSYPHLVLADMLLNMVPDDRLTMRNWAVQRDANDLMKDSMSFAIASGKLLFPLFPGTEMDTQNRCLIEDAMGVKRMTEMGEKMLEGRVGGNAQRGGRRVGRGGGYNYPMCGGEAEDHGEEMYNTHETMKCTKN